MTGKRLAPVMRFAALLGLRPRRFCFAAQVEEGLKAFLYLERVVFER